MAASQTLVSERFVAPSIRPFIEDVDDRLPDLIRRKVHVRRIPYLKGLFSDTARILTPSGFSSLQYRGESASTRFRCTCEPSFMGMQTSRGLGSRSALWRCHRQHCDHRA
jgi:hypothetical protein